MKTTRTMKTLAAPAIATALAFSATLVGSPSALAEDFECRDEVGAVTIVGNLIVPDDATCVLVGTEVQGNIVVKSRANLDASGVTATGGVQGESPARVEIRRSTLGNSVSLRKAEDVTPPDDGELAVINSFVKGDIQLEENREPIRLEGSEVVGSIQANKNTGGVEITGNLIGNGLQCQDNTPPPIGSGNVAKQFQGQCPSPAFGTTSP